MPQKQGDMAGYGGGGGGGRGGGSTYGMTNRTTTPRRAPKPVQKVARGVAKNAKGIAVGLAAPVVAKAANKTGKKITAINRERGRLENIYNNNVNTKNKLYRMYAENPARYDNMGREEFAKMYMRQVKATKKLTPIKKAAPKKYTKTQIANAAIRKAKLAKKGKK